MSFVNTKINDIEGLVDGLRDFFKTNLNTKIDLINTEKGDNLIEHITADDNHYLVGGNLQELPNHDAVNISVEKIEHTSINYKAAKIISVNVELMFNENRREETYSKALRYCRALLEVAEEYEASTTEVDVIIEESVPVSVMIRNRNLIIVGVSMSCAMC